MKLWLIQIWIAIFEEFDLLELVKSLVSSKLLLLTGWHLIWKCYFCYCYYSGTNDDDKRENKTTIKKKRKDAAVELLQMRTNATRVWKEKSGTSCLWLGGLFRILFVSCLCFYYSVFLLFFIGLDWAIFGILLDLLVMRKATLDLIVSVTFFNGPAAAQQCPARWLKKVTLIRCWRHSLKRGTRWRPLASWFSQRYHFWYREYHHLRA